MTYQWSPKLAEIMNQLQDDTPIDLRTLAERVSKSLHSSAANALFRHCTGHMAPGTICRHLNECVAHDSVVRDMLTIGHLGKLLARMNTLQATGDSRIVGLPNRLFDGHSQAERAEFAATGNILPIDSEVLNVAGVRLMLQKESEALSTT